MRQDMEPHFIGQGPWTGCWPVTTDQRAVYAPINQTRLRLDFAGKTCRVEAENNMPNFSHYEVRLGDGAWQKAEAIPYAWALSPGANVLAARGVNKYGLAGPQSEVHARILEPFTEAETILPPKPAP
jgi:hypothetical protein